MHALVVFVTFIAAVLTAGVGFGSVFTLLSTKEPMDWIDYTIEIAFTVAAFTCAGISVLWAVS